THDPCNEAIQYQDTDDQSKAVYEGDGQISLDARSERERVKA
ncbi:unnamed protein product, partial [marine sediment metagenome]